MKNVGIITIVDKNNYGNRLQNYALQYYCENKLHVKAYSLLNNPLFNNKKDFHINLLKSLIKKIIKYDKSISTDRSRCFMYFDDYINYYKKTVTAYSKLEEFDYLIVGSDQVWNPNFMGLSDLYVLKNVDDYKKISYAASFGVSSLNISERVIVSKYISRFKMISVREDMGKKFIDEYANRSDTIVVVDPTMLLTEDEWIKVERKPKCFDSIIKKKYILNYFLGDLSDSILKEIKKIAMKYDCQIINILDKEDQFYASGPSEFLYLERNAFLICTDSFHSSVFAILFNRPFVVFDREQKGIENMNTRIDTLIDKFKLKNRRYNGKNITEDNLNHDYTEAYKILEKERKKSDDFLRKALGFK